MARIAFGGFEIPDYQADDLVRTSNIVFSYITTADLVHKDAAGNGGTYSLRGDATAGGGAAIFRQLGAPYTPVEAWYRFTVRIAGSTTTGGAGDGARLMLTQGTATQIEIRLRAIPTSTIQIFRGFNGTLVATSIAGLFPYDRFFLCEVHARLATVGGFVRIYIDDPGTYTTPTFSFSGDTQALATPGVNSIGWGGRSIVHHDDWAINSISLSGTAISGDFTPGETITGLTSGASATLTQQFGLNTFVLEQWNGIAFLDGETIQGGTSSETATVFAPTVAYAFGLEPQSWGPQEGFTVALAPDGTGASNDWNNVASAPQTDNWQYVDENPPDTTQFVLTNSTNALDLYTHTSLPVTAFSIKAVSSYIYGNRDGTGLSEVNAALYLSTTTYLNAQTAVLPTSFGALYVNWYVSPDTLDVFTPGEVNASQIGYQSQT